MTPTATPPKNRNWTPAELRSLPAIERDAILADAALRASNDYLNNPELTAFEAFGRADVNVDSSDARPR